MTSLGTVARTVTQLSPLQLAFRPVDWLRARLLRDVPSGHPPAIVRSFTDAPDALARLAEAERARGEGRVARLSPSRLRDYERCYGLELGAHGSPAAWASPVAVEAFPASVRARRIAVAARLGVPGLDAELARAARAVLLKLELHLLGNHLLENGLGLACAGAVAEGPEATLWWTIGRAILDRELAGQFLPDGGHFERSASYHLGLTAGLLELIELARPRRPVPERFTSTASRALAWANAVRAPDGSYPLFNDAALDAAPTIDDVLALGRALGFSVREPRAVTLLESTGWVVARGERGAMLVVDAGPDAPYPQPGHAHADGLSYELWAHGERAVVDYGVASYGDDEARAITRSTRVHNTLTIDDRDSCEVWGAFRVGRRGRGRIERIVEAGGALELALSHDGYRFLPGKPEHRRGVVFHEGELIVDDSIVATRPHRFCTRVRVAAGALAKLRVEGTTSRVFDDVWYPRHGASEPARVFEQRGSNGERGRVRLAW